MLWVLNFGTIIKEICDQSIDVMFSLKVNNIVFLILPDIHLKNGN